MDNDREVCASEQELDLAEFGLYQDTECLVLDAMELVQSIELGILVEGALIEAPRKTYKVGQRVKRKGGEFIKTAKGWRRFTAGHKKKTAVSRHTKTLHKLYKKRDSLNVTDPEHRGAIHQLHAKIFKTHAKLKKLGAKYRPEKPKEPKGDQPGAGMMRHLRRAALIKKMRASA